MCRRALGSVVGLGREGMTVFWGITILCATQAPPRVVVDRSPIRASPCAPAALGSVSLPRCSRERPIERPSALPRHAKHLTRASMWCGRRRAAWPVPTGGTRDGPAAHPRGSARPGRQPEGGRRANTQVDASTLTRSSERRNPAARTRSTSPSRSGGSASTTWLKHVLSMMAPCMLHQH